MMRYSLLVTALLYISAAAGCGKSESGPAASIQATPAGHHEVTPQSGVGRVAVINLETIAQRLGRLDEINGSYKQKQAELNERLSVLQNTYQGKFDTKKKEFGESPSEEQTKELLILQRQYNTNVAQERTRAQQELALHESALKKLFHEEVRPIARRAAEERGLGVVMTHNYIFAGADAVDVTEDVVQRMMKQIAASKSLPVARVSELPHGGDFQSDQK